MAEIIVNPMTDSKEQMLAILGMMAETFQNSIIPATDMGRGYMMILWSHYIKGH